MRSMVILAVLAVTTLILPVATAGTYKSNIEIVNLSDILDTYTVIRKGDITIYSVKKLPCIDDVGNTSQKDLLVISELRNKLRPYEKDIWCISVDGGQEGFTARIYLKSGASREVAEVVGRRALTVSGVSRAVVVMDDIGLTTLRDPQILELVKSVRERHTNVFVKNINGVIVLEVKPTAYVMHSIVDVLKRMNVTGSVLTKPLADEIYVIPVQEGEIAYANTVVPVETMPPPEAPTAVSIQRLPGILIALAAILIGMLSYKLVG